MQYLSELQHLYATVPIKEALKKTAFFFPGRVKFSSSLGQEDQLLTDIIARNNIPINIFTIDTGRLFHEAYDTLDVTMSKYKINVDGTRNVLKAALDMPSDRRPWVLYASSREVYGQQDRLPVHEGAPTSADSIVIDP